MPTFHAVIRARVSVYGAHEAVPSVDAKASLDEAPSLDMTDVSVLEVEDKV